MKWSQRVNKNKDAVESFRLRADRAEFFFVTTLAEDAG